MLIASLTACGPDSRTDGTEGTGLTTGSFGSDAASTVDTLPSASSDETAPENEESGLLDFCPAADASVDQAAAFVQAPGWPEETAITASCEGVSIATADGFVGLLDISLDCMDQTSGFTGDVHVYVAESAISGQLDEIPGSENLLLSFWWPSADVINPGDSIFQLSLRSADGSLVLLAYTGSLFDGYLAEGDSLKVGRPFWLTSGTEEYEAWNEPFGEMYLRSIGCPSRESLRPGSSMETPLVVEFGADLGSVEIYDRNFVSQLLVDGEAFDVIVSDAFFRNDLNCAHCPVTAVTFLILRSDV